MIIQKNNFTVELDHSPTVSLIVILYRQTKSNNNNLQFTY